MPRVVADTNIVVSALLWRGAPHLLIEAGESGALEFHTSLALLEELSDVLGRRKLGRAVRATGKSIDVLMKEYRAVAKLVVPDRMADSVSRDPDDDAVLACALAARADVIVSGDGDLLVLGRYRGIPVLSPAEALRRFVAPKA